MVTDIPDCAPRHEERAERLEEHRLIIVEAWRRQGMKNAEVAAFLGRSVSLVSKIRNGRLPITARIVNQMIDLLCLDRTRLYLAIEVAHDGALYFDPTFRNVCYATMGFLHELRARLESSDEFDEKCIFAAFSRSAVERVSAQAGGDVAHRFCEVGHVQGFNRAA